MAKFGDWLTGARFGEDPFRPMSAFGPSRALRRGPAKGFFNVTVLDRLTPSLDSAEGVAGEMLASGFKQTALELEENIKRRFREGPRVWAPLKPSAVAWKARHGIPWPEWTLRESLTLATNVERLRVFVSVHRGKDRIPVSATLTVPARAFFGSPYVVYHEMGWGQTRRGFIREGIEDTYGDIEGLVAGPMARVSQILNNPAGHGVTPRVHDSRFRFVIFATMPLRSFVTGIVAPPTKLWSLIGMASDIRAAVRGQFGPEALALWMRNWGLGQVGLTAKVHRRRLRRLLWRNR